ncbi:hypothetical protein TUM17387_37120 [Shewanella carassii]|nr:hypothetical protein TUM17387_37120 [Shewanella carassii]
MHGFCIFQRGDLLEQQGESEIRVHQPWMGTDVLRLGHRATLFELLLNLVGYYAMLKADDYDLHASFRALEPGFSFYCQQIATNGK